jgi:hypothetical protein
VISKGTKVVLNKVVRQARDSAGAFASFMSRHQKLNISLPSSNLRSSIQEAALLLLYNRFTLSLRFVPSMSHDSHMINTYQLKAVCHQPFQHYIARPFNENESS